MDIVDRFIEIRKSTGLSQTDFGARVGVGRGMIKNIESRTVAPKENFLKLVCKEYHINPDWLLKGVGEMPLGDTELLLDELSKDYDLDETDIKILKAYLKLDHEQRIALKEFLKALLE